MSKKKKAVSVVLKSVVLKSDAPVIIRGAEKIMALFPKISWQKAMILALAVFDPEL